MRFIGELRSEGARDRACPSARLPATLRPARGRARTAPDAWRARPPCRRHARHDGTRRRRMLSTPAALRPPRAGGVAPRHSRSGAPRACSGRANALSTSAVSAGMRGLARGALGPRERGARRLRPEAPHRDPRDHQLVGGPRRGRQGRGVELGERTLGLVEAPDQEEAPDLEIPRVRGVDPVAVLLRASPAPRRAPSPASPGRARRARSRPRRRRTSRGPRPPSDRRHAPHVAAAPSLERDRRAAPSRCLEARERARRRAGRPASARRGDHPPRARAPRP